MFRKLFGLDKKEETSIQETDEQIAEDAMSSDQETAEQDETAQELAQESGEQAEIEIVEDAEDREEAINREEAIPAEKEKGLILTEDEIADDISDERVANILDEISDTVSYETAEATLEISEFETTEAQATEEEEHLGFFAKLKKGLSGTTKNFTSKIESLFSGYTRVDDEIFEELEELLILADLGFETAIEITEELRKRSEEKKIEEVSVLETELQSIIEEILVSAAEENQIEDQYPKIMVIVGVNGVGKTTSIGKISMQLKNEGKSVMLAAGDTFRAAAADQLSIWAERAGVPIVRSNEGADPSAVIFDGIQSAKAKNMDVLICDTAGRLHNKKNLMQELEKIFRIVDREYPEAQKEVMLVIDATTGQNALSQAKTFSEVAPLTGIILTKLDGTAKGGVVIGLSKELKIPIKYVGVGEKIGDLQKFNARDFAKALFSKEG